MRILIQAGAAASLPNFRGTLIKTLLGMGHKVACSAPPASAEVAHAIAELGAEFFPVKALQRAGLNPFNDILARRELSALVAAWRPDLTLAYTIKPIVLGIPAAQKAGVRHCYPMITGLGAAFNTPGLKGFVLRRVAAQMYRSAMRGCRRVIVQNPEIAEFLQRKRMVTDAEQVVVVPGSGVDLERFQQVPPPRGAPCYLLLGRMLYDKGVREFVVAARIVRKQRPDARFLLVGDTDPNPSAVTAALLDEWNREGIVEYRPAVADVRALLGECTTYVLPSYHEGMPRSVLEAMAVGRAVVTTDTIGCRETIFHAGAPDETGVRTGENGLLVPVRRADALAAAMLRLADDTELRKRMGVMGRRRAEQHFDVKLINQQMLRAMDLLPGDLRGPGVAVG